MTTTRHPQRTCIVCQQLSKYTCASCRANYCSVACCRKHKGPSISAMFEPTPAKTHATETCYAPLDARADVPPVSGDMHSSVHPDVREGAFAPKNKNGDENSVSEPLQDPPPLRPLTTLKWPYVPDTSAYPDPLTRDDPKPLQMHHYEALATSPAIREILGSNPRLCELLTSVNALRGAEREETLQRVLGVDSRLLKNDDGDVPLDEDTKAFRAFAEAVEMTVRGGREDALGLDWD